jgi:uncharacterized protein
LGPPQGVGIGLRRELVDALECTTRRVDWLEVIAENFVGLGGRPRDVWRRMADRWPLIPHGVSLSVGGNAPPGFLEALCGFVNELEAPWYSDHLCYAFLGGQATFDLLPLPRTDEAVTVAAERARAARLALGRPLLLENITFYAQMPGATMEEATFLTRILEASGADLLLDVNNLYLNAVNHGLDPVEQLHALPLNRVKQLHLAGHMRDGEVLLDTHSAPIAAPVWELYVETLKAVGAVPTLVEWDQHIPSLDAVLDEADKARTLMERYG